jgi:hypothetical protein
VRNYYDIISRMEPRETAVVPPLDTPQASWKGSAPSK